MAQLDLIRKIKSAVVAIGISDNEKSFPIEIGGTGFIIDPQGFVLTATHIIDQLVLKQTVLQKQGVKASICAYQIRIQDHTPTILQRGLLERRRFKIKPTSQFPSQEDYDVTLCRMIGNEKWSAIEIAKPSKIDVLSEIVVCGYPAGSGTFNVFDPQRGLRFSPLAQVGKVAAIMPIDDVLRPTGIQTDIVGTGGSSGSPIVRIEDENVIGIIQSVISAPVVTLQKEELIAKGQIGLMSGISNFVLYAGIKVGLEQMKEELDENGRLKEEYQKKYSKSEVSGTVDIDLKNPEEAKMKD